VTLLGLTAFAASVTSAGAAGETLKGVVGPGSTITLKTSGGNTVTKVDAGTYTFAIQDLADDHNFHLQDPESTSPPASPKSLTPRGR